MSMTQIGFAVCVSQCRTEYSVKDTQVPSQPVLWNSSISQIDGCLVEFDPTLALGRDEQSMIFLLTNVKPFWMNVAERVERSFGRPNTNTAALQPCKQCNKDLAIDLSVPGNVLDLDQLKLEKRQELALAQYISLKNIVSNTTEPGWFEKSRKGYVRCYGREGGLMYHAWMGRQL